MAKGKDKNKSIVGNKFSSSRRPSADELNKLAADVTGAKAKEPAPEVKKKMGRPKSNHGFEKYTTLVNPKILEFIKIRAIKEKKQQFEIIDEALRLYYEQYKD